MLGTRVGAALIAVAICPAIGGAQINTTEGGVDQWSSAPSWYRTDRVLTMGSNGLFYYKYVTTGASVGQVFRTPAASAFLEDFSFFFGSRSGTFDFRAFLAEWNGTGVGAAVWTSPVLSPPVPGATSGPLGGFQEVTFTPNFDLSPNQTYVAYIEINSVSGWSYPVYGEQRVAFRETGLADGRGRVVVTRGTGTAEFFDGEDAAFTAIFRSTVPEPATVALLASGMFGVGLIALRRRRQSIES